MIETVPCKRCGQPVTWVDSTQAATMIGRNVSRVKQLIDEGRLPNSEKRGGGHGGWHIPLQSIAAYLEAEANR